MTSESGNGGKLILGTAGVTLGAAWGFLAALPPFSYLLALPGSEWTEDLSERVLLSLGGLGPGPDRVVVVAGLYALLFGVGATLAAQVIARIPVVNRGLAWRSPLLAGLLGLAPIVLLPPIWCHRGIEGGALPALAFALGFSAWTTITAPALAAAFGFVRRRPAVGAGLPLALLGILLVWTTDASLRDADTATQKPSPRRVLLIGLDAASWSNLDPGLDSERLASLLALRERGASGTLHTTRPTLSPIIWTTIVTGVPAEQHGIRDFELKGVPYSSNSRRALAIWDMLPLHGLRSAIHYWWASWPAEETGGLVVSDRFLDRELSRRVAPDSEAKRLDALAEVARVGAASVASLVEFPDAIFPERHRTKIGVLDEILERDEVATALGESAMRGDYDLVATYLRAPDAVGHKFWMWHFHDRHPVLASWIYGEPDSDQSMLGPLTDRVFEIVDAQVGRLLESAGDDVNIVIVSDHGMTSVVPMGAAPGAEPETGSHHPSGLILMAGPDIRSGVTLRGATVYDVFPTLLYLLDLPVPEGLKGRVLSEGMSEVLRAERLLAHSPSLKPRDVGDPTPIPTKADEGYLKQLRALGYVID